MNVEKLITFGVIGLVFVLRTKAQNKKRKQMEEEKARQAELQKAQKPQFIEEEAILPPQPSPPPVYERKPVQKISERGFDFHRDIEERSLDRNITSRELKTQFGEKKQLISDGLKEKISVDNNAYSIKIKPTNTRISALVSSVGSKKRLFIINEILNPPYID